MYLIPGENLHVAYVKQIWQDYNVVLYYNGLTLYISGRVMSPVGSSSDTKRTRVRSLLSCVILKLKTSV